MNDRKPIYLTRHAVHRALKFDLSPEMVEKIVREGEREGKAKPRRVTSYAIGATYGSPSAKNTPTR